MTNPQAGQYKIGSFIFGRNTLFPIEKVDFGGFDVNVQDFQVTSSDEIRFGMDTFKPLPIQFVINAFQNSVMKNVVALTGSNAPTFEDDPEVWRFIQEWRDDTYRSVWGSTKPLYYGREDGTVVEIKGRPSKLAVSQFDPNRAYRKIVAEYRCADCNWLFEDTGVFG